MHWLLAGYMWLFIHRPFEVWPWLGAFRIERVYMILVIACWVGAPKTWIRTRSTFPVFVLAATYLVASQTSPYASFAQVEDWFKLFVFYLLVVTTARDLRDLKFLVIGFVVVMALYEFHSLREYFNGRGEWRMGTWRMVGVDVTMADPNTFGGSVNLGLPYLYAVWGLAEKRWQKIAIGGMSVLGAVCILLTGSRSALLTLVLLSLCATLVSRYRWRLICVAAVLAPLIWVNLRTDLQDRYFTLVDSSRGPQNAQQSAEGRTKSFWDGMNSFAADPIFGAGLESYRAKTGFATHNLYHQAMGELGSFGLAVLIGFAWAVPANALEARKLMLHREPDRDELFLYRVCIASVVVCALLFVLGWGAHNLSRYNWLWAGAFSGLAVQFLRQSVESFPHDDMPDAALTFDDNA